MQQQNSQGWKSHERRQVSSGHGFDVHRFSEKFDPDKPLMLGGLRSKSRRSLLAHSDGDVVLHAVCDAILGAIGEGDIGQHFPDTDEAFANVASSLLLKQVLSMPQVMAGFR